MAIKKLDALTVPEQWRIVAEFPDYEVSNYGNVRRATPETQHGTWASGQAET